MMKIDRSNYEIWLIDWLDGNLNDMQAEQVLQFLEENADLKEEFGEFELFSLKPSHNLFPDKNILRRSAADLSQTQLEYLCVASLENDLTEDQLTELNHLIGKDPEKRKTFELIRKTRLNPENVVYPDKKRLIRRTALHNVIRLSLIGSSAAAVIAIAFILYFNRTPELIINHESTLEAVVTDSIQKVNPVLEIAVTESLKHSVNLVVPVKKQHLKLVAQDQHHTQSVLENSDSVPNRSQAAISKIKIQADLNLKTKVPGNLISLNYTVIPVQADEERSKFSRFIARNFREKFLKDRPSKDSPLKVYEIAKVSVNGLNKLLGWEMALDERKDPNGQLKSVYFSSKILKFNAPVKNSESPR